MNARPERAPKDGTSPEEDNTVSSASLCMSPTSDVDRTAPLYSSTPIVPRTLANGYTAVNQRNNRDDNDNRETTDTDNQYAETDNGVHDVDNRIASIDNGLHVDNRVPSIDNVGAVKTVESRIDVENRVGSVDSRIGSIDNVDNRTSNDDVVNLGKRLGKIIDYDTANGNVTVNIVSESTNSMDVLSGGESDAGDTLSRRNNNNNSIASGVTHIGDTARRRGGDVTYYVAKELLMTERTYKRDLELITVSWSKRVGRLGRTSSSGAEAGALARGCLALEPLALPAGALLARLERALAAAPAPPASNTRTDAMDTEEPEYKKIAELLYEYLSSTFDAYTEYTCQAGTLVALVESARRRGGAASREAAAFDAAAPLPLAALLLRPLHRLLHYRRLAHELCTSCGASAGASSARAALELAERAAGAAAQQLRHVENHTALCQMQRDIVGYDKLLVAEREFIRLGCLYKHSSKGLQQRMLFLFSDLLLITSKCANGRFRAHAALALHRLRLEPANVPHAVAILGDDVNILLSASNEQEYLGWRDSLATAIENAQDNPTEVDTELTPCDNEAELAESGAAGGALAAVCWHRAASLPRRRLHAAMRTQLSGYLLRKFKNSHGWQKLWVVFAAFTLFFYKSWQDDTPLASLPLLGYSVGPPAESDGIGKEFVFKLQFKNHVYFFRADSHFTFNRWIEVLQTPMVQSDHD